MINRKDIWRLAASILVCQLAGIAGAVFTVNAIPSWYASLNKPAFSPPNWVFSPVWTTLYLLMGIALFMVWREGLKTRGVKPALRWFGFQLVLNSMWSFVFFGMRNPIAAFIELVLLWFAILFTMKSFNRVSVTAAYLLMPYFLWVTFALALNLGIVIVN